MLADQANKRASLHRVVPVKEVPSQGPEATLTFAPLPIEGPKDHQVSCVSHGPLVQIVFLYFQPVSLSRLIGTLREKQETSN